jgi:hypothetical protein
MYRKALAQAQQQIRTLVVASKGTAASGTFRGLVFEQHGHVVVQAGVWMRVRKLERPAAKESAEVRGSSSGADNLEDEAKGVEDAEDDIPISHHLLPPAQKKALASESKSVDGEVDQLEFIKGGKHKWDHPQLDIIGEMMKLEGGVYLQPVTSNNPTWDSAICRLSRIDILQFTISSSHRVVARPVQKLLDRIDPERKIPTRFIFVIPSEPSELFMEYKWQDWEKASSKPTKEGEDSKPKDDDILEKIPLQVQGVEQWVMQLALEPQPLPDGKALAHPQ